MGLTKPRAHQLQDIDYKQTARALTDTNITLSGGAPATVDGVSLALHDRVLVTGQTDASENGIYYVTTVGAGSNGTWARSLDANETGELNGGTIIMVTEGTNHADTQWKLTTDDPITIGSTNLNFALNSSAAYGVIAVAGQSSISANSVGDTLTVATGNNIVVTTNAGTETLTIAVSDTITATGNITGGNLLTGNVTVDDSGITATGNIQADMLINREQRFTTSNMMKFNQLYTGAASGSYFTNGEYQKVVTITPSGASQNYQVVGRITAQNAAETHTVYFNAALRSNTLPDLDWSILYTEEYNGGRYLDPQLWTKETTTAGFIFAFKTLATIYGTVTVDIDVIPRTSALLTNVVVNTVQDSEQASVDAGFTANDMTLIQRLQNTNMTVPGNLIVNGTITGNVTGDLTGDVTGEVTGNVSGSAATATSATTAGTVTSNAQPNITSVGTLTSISVTGNVTGGNITTAGIGTFGTMTDGTVSFTNGNISGVDELRIDQSGTGLRMTNVGAFDNDGSDNFRIFATNDLKIAANGANGTAITVDATNQDVTIINDLRVDAGNLYIGGTSVTATATELNLLDGVTGLTLGTANEILIVGTDGSSIDSTGVLTIDTASNYVGINQTSPEVTLHMTGEGAQTAQIRIEQYNDSADAPDIRTRRFRGNIASPSDVNAGDYLFRINAEGYDGGANVSYHSLQFDVGTNQAAGVMQIQTRDTGSTLATRFGVTQDGNVYFGNSAYTLPRTDGSANQVLQTDGSGSLQFVDVTATTAETVTANAQPNITSVGTLSSVTVTGNASAGNISTAGTIVATGNITGGNIITAGTVDVDRLSLTSSQTTVSPLQLTANSLQDGVGALRIDGSQADIYLNPSTATHTTVTFAVNDDQRLAFGMDNNSDFYITRRTGNVWYDDTFVIDRDTGELRYGYDLTVTGNASANNISVTNFVNSNLIPSANITYNLGSATARWNELFLAGNTIHIGSLQIKDNSGSFEVFQSDGTTPAQITGNIAAANVVGTVASATTAGTVTTAAQPNITSVGTLSSVTVTGNVSAGNVDGTTGAFTTVTGAGSGITSLNADELSSGTVPSGRLSGTYTIDISGSATTAGTVTTAAQPNITSVGTLTSVTVSGNAVIGGDLTVSGNTVYTNVTTFSVQDPIIDLGRGANGTPLGSDDGKDRGTQLYYYSGSEKSAFVGYDNSEGKIVLAKDVSISNEVVTVSSYGNAVVGGLEAATASVTGNVDAGNVNATSISGTLITAAQTNITSVGTLSSLSVTGNITVSGLVDGRDVAADGALAASAVQPGDNVSDLTNDASYIDLTDISVNTAAASGDGSLSYNNTTGVFTFTPADAGLSDYGDSNVATFLSSNFGSNTIVTTGNITAGNVIATIVGDVTGNITGSAATATSATTAGTVTTAAQPNITSVGTLTSVSVTGNVDAGNVNATIVGDVTGEVTGNVSGSAATAGTVTTAAQPNITSVGTLTSITASGNITTTGNININDRQGLYLYDSDSSNYIAIVSPSTVSGNVTFTLPGDAGTVDYVLATNGAGTLSWVEQSGGSSGASSFPNSTVTPLPSSEGNFDLSYNYAQTTQETPFETGGSDAFGVSLGEVYSMMDPAGDIPDATDLGVLT